MNKIATLLLLCTALFAQQKGTFTDSRDKKIYKTVKIGEQVWMAENLNYEAEGSRCYGEGGLVYDGGIIGLTKLSPAEIQANCKKYGRLYNWKTAMKSCPKDWHLPSKGDWRELVNFAGGDNLAGKKLKAAKGWNRDSENLRSGDGNDKFGFSTLPSGGRWGSDFGGIGDNGHWWSSSEYDGSNAYDRSMFYHLEVVGYDYHNKDYLFSVRCLQD